MTRSISICYILRKMTRRGTESMGTTRTQGTDNSCILATGAKGQMCGLIEILSCWGVLVDTAVGGFHVRDWQTRKKYLDEHADCKIPFPFLGILVLPRNPYSNFEQLTTFEKMLHVYLCVCLISLFINWIRCQGLECTYEPPPFIQAHFSKFFSDSFAVDYPTSLAIASSVALIQDFARLLAFRVGR